MGQTDRPVFRLPRRFRLPDVPQAFSKLNKLAGEGPVVLDFGQVDDFDSAAVAFIRYVRRNLPGVEIIEVSGMLARAEAEHASEHPVRKAEKTVDGGPWLAGLFSGLAERFTRTMGQVSRFMIMLSDEFHHLFLYVFKDRRGVYPGETWNQLFFMGYRSYPITILLVFLVGVTISATSADQLRVFGADVYLADLVGLSMLRELVPIMTGVILAGKVGAAVAAELATMSVLEEVDALRTMGISPERFLMVPRILGITLAVPLLVVIADVVGIGGGVFTAAVKFGIPPSAFIHEMMTVCDFGDFFWGLVKTITFGWAVVIGSGYKGLTVGRSAAEVGRATTESVVLSISMIVLIDCIFAFILY